jgi:hypothetical protein
MVTFLTEVVIRAAQGACALMMIIQAAIAGAHGDWFVACYAVVFGALCVALGEVALKLRDGGQ